MRRRTARKIAAWPRGMTVPAHEIEIYLALGWSLTDEPTPCGGARIFPLAAAQDAVKRVGE